MCGRYTLSTPGAELSEVFGLGEGVELEPRFNIAPTQLAPIVRQQADQRIMVSCRWGLVPSWATDPSVGARMINARSETAREKPAYRDAFRRRRCLVPADGFYEWKKEGSHRQPYYFSLSSGAPFALAGLWEQWHRGERVVESFTILTTSANAEVSDIHDRMPVFLSPESWPAWLAVEGNGSATVGKILGPAADGVLARRPVSTLVNSPANDSSRCIEAIDLSGLPSAPQQSLF